MNFQQETNVGIEQKCKISTQNAICISCKSNNNNVKKNTKQMLDACGNILIRFINTQTAYYMTELGQYSLFGSNFSVASQKTKVIFRDKMSLKSSYSFYISSLSGISNRNQSSSRSSSSKLTQNHIRLYRHKNSSFLIPRAPLSLNFPFCSFLKFEFPWKKTNFTLTHPVLHTPQLEIKQFH